MLQKRILQAIHEGIRKSLLSFDDVQFDNTSSNNTNQKVSKNIKDWKWIQDNFVDLDLPSRLLWCKWNIVATNEDTPESWYGSYYAWGSTKLNDSDVYDWKTAPFNNGYIFYDEEYFIKHAHEAIINSGTLYLEHDVAYRTNNLMHMPTMQQIQELINETEHCWIENYNGINGLNGQLFTGKNGNTLFVPFAGYKDDLGLIKCDRDAMFLWTQNGAPWGMHMTFFVLWIIVVLSPLMINTGDLVLDQ